MSSTLAARPTATSMTSARISSGVPPSGPASTQMPSFVGLDLGRVEAGLGHDPDAAPREAPLDELADVAVLERARPSGRYSSTVTAVPMSW